jgi:crossover junction endodeoxyribonuclease RusA
MSTETINSALRTYHFTVYCHPEPQGSSKAFIIAGKARITSNNGKLKPYRQTVTCSVLDELNRQRIDTPVAPKHEPVWLGLRFIFQRPPSAPKRRRLPAVKPDLDKLVRATLDALTGVLYLDDAQVCRLSVAKEYGEIERVEIIQQNPQDLNGLFTGAR